MTATWRGGQSDDALDDGWDIFETLSPGHADFEIERDDELELFDSDEAAWRHVVGRAAQGSELHVKALAFLALNAYDELLGIARVLCGAEYQLYTEKVKR